MFMIWLAFVTGIIYFAIISLFLYGWTKLKEYTPSHSSITKKLSIIIPIRNEEKQIKSLVADLQKQEYPSHLLEFFFIDDHSTDNSVKIIQEITDQRITLLSLTKNRTGKKAALSLGIANAQGDIIITTDADCRIPQTWAACIASYHSDFSPLLLMAPVTGISRTLFSHMQLLELFSLQGSTAGSANIGHPIMSNGANLSFPQKLYPQIKDIYDDKKVESGDDMFLLHHLKKIDSRRIHYLKSRQATIHTELAPGIAAFLQQRKRWTSKAKYYKDKDTIFTAMVVLFTNLMLVCTLTYGIISHHFQSFVIILIFKSLIDIVLLTQIAKFFNKRNTLWLFPFVQSLYFIYICITVFLAFFTTNTWKKRTIH